MLDFPNETLDSFIRKKGGRDEDREIDGRDEPLCCKWEVERDCIAGVVSPNF